MIIEYTSTPVGTNALFQLASHSDNAEADDDNVWKNLLGELLGSGNQRSRQIKLGKILNTHSDKVIAGYKIERDTIIRGVPHYHLKKLQTSSGVSHISSNGSGPPVGNNAVESEEMHNKAQNKGGECGERGECLDYPHTRETCDALLTPSDFYIDRGGKHSPHPPHSPSVFSSTIVVPTAKMKYEQHRYDEPALVVITEPSQLEAILPTLIASPALALDTETTGIDPLTHRLRLVQCFLPDTVYIIDVAKVPVAMLTPIFATPKRWIGHNLKFDVKFLMAAGLPVPTGQLVDTMLCSQLLYAGTADGTLSKSGLAAVVQRELDLTLDKALQTSDWSQALSAEQLQYAARDVAVLWALADALMQKLEDAELSRIAQIEGDCLSAIAAMELNGLPIDVAQWQVLTQAEERRIIEVSSSMAALLNGQGHNLFGECLVNWDSPEQMLSLLKTRGHDIANTDATTLKLLRTDDPMIPMLLDYREASKRVSTYGEAWLQKVHPKTGRLHPDYLQLGSQAGRMSCQKPNVQQVPRESQYRAAVCAPEGHVLIKADYSQIELRIAAMMAKDTKMLEAFRAGKDLHVVTGAAVMGVPEMDVTKDHRQISKSLNFGLLYGMGEERLREYAASTYGVTLTDEEAAHHRQRFFTAYQGLRRWHQSTGHRLKEGPVDSRTLAGRRRLQVGKFTEALNTPVQGSGADGLKLALGRLFHHQHQAPAARLVAAVHDEIVAECPASEAHTTEAWLRQHMTDAMQELVGDTVPVVVDVHQGRTWAGEAE